MTFELAGRQYVAIMAGWGGVATLTGGESMNLPGMKNRSRLLVFALDGKAQLPPPAPAPAKVERVPQPVTAAPEQVQAGKQLYGQFCSVCHGMGTISGGLIPDLRQSSDATREHFQQIVLQGALKPLGMPSFDDSLKPEEVEQIKLYVMSREYEDYMARHKAAP